MRVLWLILILFLVCSSIQAQTTSDLSRPNVLIAHVTVINPGSVPSPDETVIIQGDKITSLSRAATPNTLTGDWIKVDGRGKFLIPGLWDMHVHALSKGEPDRFFPLFIANGITGIRDMGGDIPLSEIETFKEQIRSGSRLGPEIFAAGPILEGEHPFWPFSLAVKNSEDAKRDVDELVRQGADFIKVYNTLSRQAYFSIASESKQKKIPFVGHVPDDVTPLEASNSGQKSIEHLWGIPTFVSSQAKQLQELTAKANDEQDSKVASNLFYQINQTVLSTYDSKKASSLFREFDRNHTWQTPTLIVLHSYSYIHDPAIRQDSRLQYIPDGLVGFWNSMGGQPDPRNDEIQKRLFAHNVAIVRAMHVAGVSLLAGTDTPNPYTYPGFSLHDELQLLVSAGLTPSEALQAATSSAAEFLGVNYLFGSVNEGKIANLVLLDANPLIDIRNTQTIRAVVVRGRYLDRNKLDQILSEQRISR